MTETVIEALERTVKVSSVVPAPRQRVWERIISPEGINDELSPLLRMTIPRNLKGATIDDVPLGEPLGRSWILLFGVVPVDYDDLVLAEVEPGHRFQEDSRMLTMRRWRHERVLELEGASTRVTDRLEWELRSPLRWVGADLIARSLVARLFRHRHRRLSRHFSSD